jgi:2-phosphosulfolactate phosphatase
MLRVVLSPRLLEPASVQGCTAVVIDVIRATTTIVTAVRNGAAGIRPCASVEEARAVAGAMAPGSYLLGGERGGVKIEGFDLGNSPREYAAERVADKVVVFTTTNGTRALRLAERAERVLVGALINVSATAGVVAMEGREAVLLCAGVDGQVCAEDALCAGGIAETLAAGGGWTLDDSARLAAAAWRAVSGGRGTLEGALLESAGGRNLAAVGLEADLRDCAAVDQAALVPEFRPGTGLIGV